MLKECLCFKFYIIALDRFFLPIQTGQFSWNLTPGEPEKSKLGDSRVNCGARESRNGQEKMGEGRRKVNGKPRLSLTPLTAFGSLRTPEVFKK